MKRHSALVKLSSDHHHGLSIARKLISVIGKSSLEIDIVFRQFTEFYKNELLTHFSEEESILAPYLINDPLIIRMLKEHEQIKALFREINSLAGSFSAELVLFGNLLQDHIRFEEKELFPLLEKTLSDKELIEIENKIVLKKGAN